MDDVLKTALTNLGFPKTADKFIFRPCAAEDEEDSLEAVQRTITILGGLLYLFETHMIGFYERTMLLNEFRVLTTAFAQTQASANGEEAEAVTAICAAANELVANVNARIAPKVREESERLTRDPFYNNVVLFRVGSLARTLATNALHFLSDAAILDYARAPEPPEDMVRLVVKSLEGTYHARVTEEISNTFALHARRQVVVALKRQVTKRHLTV